MILLPHFPILWVLCGKGFLAPCWGTRAGMISFGLRGLLVCAWAVTALLLHIMPFGGTGHGKKHPPSLRLWIMNGGRRILRFCFYGLLLQLLICWFYLFPESVRLIVPAH